MNDLPKLKTQLKSDDVIKTFLSVELVDLDAIEELDESFRQFLFAQWILDNDEKPNFKDARAKLHKLLPKNDYKEKDGRIILDPTTHEDVKSSIGQFLTKVDYNETYSIQVVVPEALRLALFDSWDKKGLNLVRVLYHYGKLWTIDVHVNIS